MIKPVVAFAGILSLTFSVSSVAQNAIEEKDIKSGKVTIQPDRGYVFLKAPNRFAGTFIRIADKEDIKEYQKAREAILAKAQEDYKKAYKRWEERAEREQASGRRSEEPVKPEEENFQFVFIEKYQTSDFGPSHVYSKGGGEFTYLESLKPGGYIWYGPVFFNRSEQRYTGQCYCMGTIRFEVRPGVITNLGNSLFAMPRWEDDPNAPPLKVRYSDGFNALTIKFPVSSGELDYDLPATLAGFESEIPDFHAVGKINNFFGQMISRVAPIDGVLRYERDKVIDVRAEIAAAQIAAAEEAIRLASEEAPVEGVGEVEEEADEKAESSQ